VVAGERGGAVLRGAEPGRAELLPAHVRKACKAATGEKRERVRDALERALKIGTTGTEAVKEAIRLMPRR